MDKYKLMTRIEDIMIFLYQIRYFKSRNNKKTTENKTKNMHYVFQGYLKSWSAKTDISINYKESNKNPSVWCAYDIVEDSSHRYSFTSPDIPKEIKKIASEIDFYRIPLLIFWERKRFQKLSEYMYQTQDLGKISLDFKSIEQKTKSLLNTSRTKKEIDIKRNNMIEDFFKQSENKLLEEFKYIELHGNIKGKEEEFIHAVLIQYFRTKFMKESLDNAVKEYLEYKKDYFSRGEAIAYYLMWPLADVLTKACIKHGLKVHILNNSLSNFITTDQPVINIHADYKNKIEPDDFELYYPISPSRAILIDRETKKPIIDESLADWYNSKMDKAKKELLVFESKKQRDEYLFVDDYDISEKGHYELNMAKQKENFIKTFSNKKIKIETNKTHYIND